MLPQKYQSIPTAVASYDWLDLTSGAGYKKYYLVSSYLAGGTVNYFLSSKVVDGPTGIWFKTAGNGDLDFDITMKTPSIIGGSDAVINIPYHHMAGNATTLTVTIYHVTTGAVETSLGTLTTGRTAGGGGAEDYMECMKIPLTAKKFAIGEKLRVNVVWTSTGTVTISFDPAGLDTATDKDGRTIALSASVQIPFKIDIT